jgi:hypothetical protein|tara:strand:- start:608 stop:877 length:270 start_codon:yes stop_codon:yes gene_type:complete
MGEKIMTIMSIINGNTSLYDLLVDAYAKQDFKRGYYITKLMVSSRVNLDHFVSYLSKKRTNNQMLDQKKNQQFYRNCFAIFLWKGKINK